MAGTVPDALPCSGLCCSVQLSHPSRPVPSGEGRRLEVEDRATDGARGDGRAFLVLIYVWRHGRLKPDVLPRSPARVSPRTQPAGTRTATPQPRSVAPRASPSAVTMVTTPVARHATHPPHPAQHLRPGARRGAGADGRTARRPDRAGHHGVSGRTEVRPGVHIHSGRTGGGDQVARGGPCRMASTTARRRVTGARRGPGGECHSNHAYRHPACAASPGGERCRKTRDCVSASQRHRRLVGSLTDRRNHRHDPARIAGRNSRATPSPRTGRRCRTIPLAGLGVAARFHVKQTWRETGPAWRRPRVERAPRGTGLAVERRHPLTATPSVGRTSRPGHPSTGRTGEAAPPWSGRTTPPSGAEATPPVAG